MMSRIIAALLILISMNQVQAEEAHYYLGVDVGDYGLDIKNSSTSYDNASGYSLRLGYDFNNWLALEGHYSAPEDFEVSGSTSTLSGNSLSLFGRFNLRFSKATLYVIAGASQANYLGTTEVGSAYGVGLDVYGSKDTALTFAYTSYYNDTNASNNDITVDAITFGITHYIGNRPRIYSRY